MGLRTDSSPSCDCKHSAIRNVKRWKTIVKIVKNCATAAQFSLYASSACAFAYLVKPFSPRELLDTIEDIFAGNG